MDDFEIVGGPLRERIVPVSAPVLATPSKSTTQAPSFSSSVIESNRSDGYWVETFHFDQKDKVPGIIA